MSTIIDASKVAKSSVHFILKNLLERGLVSVRSHRWSLTPSGLVQLSSGLSGGSSSAWSIGLVQSVQGVYFEPGTRQPDHRQVAARVAEELLKVGPTPGPLGIALCGVHASLERQDSPQWIQGSQRRANSLRRNGPTAALDGVLPSPMTARPALRLAQDARGDALDSLLARWRVALDLLRAYGDERGAAVVERLAGELEAAMAATGAPVRRAPPAGPDSHLTVEQAAARLGVSEQWIYRHWRTQLRDCARLLGTRTLRFSERALEERCRRLQPGDL